MSPEQIARLEAEMKSYASQPARNQAEREEIQCRVREFERQIENGKNSFKVGHP
jgi:hypothetical protein